MDLTKSPICFLSNLIKENFVDMFRALEIVLMLFVYCIHIF